MKKIMAILFATLLLLSLVGCSSFSEGFSDGYSVGYNEIEK